MFRKIFSTILIIFIVFNVTSYFQEMTMLDDGEISAIHNNKSAYEPFQLPTLMGDTVLLENRNKFTVLYFFAPWCHICHFSIENLEDIYLQNHDVNVIAIALDYVSVEEVTEFSKQHQLTFPIALGNTAVKNSFKISGYPSYYVLDEENNIVSKSKGYSTKLGLYLRTL